MSHTIHFLAQMDHVHYLFEKATLSGRLARWQALLCEFDLIYNALKAIKGQAITDHLAGLPLADYEPVRTDFLDEEIMALEDVKEVPERYWRLYFDGALNS